MKRRIGSITVMIEVLFTQSVLLLKFFSFDPYMVLIHVLSDDAILLDYGVLIVVWVKFSLCVWRGMDSVHTRD